MATTGADADFIDIQFSLTRDKRKCYGTKLTSKFTNFALTAMMWS
jgi:hypothetical protein